MNAPFPRHDITGLELEHSRFTVPGMRCAGCIAKIERGLNELDGVESARVNFSTKRVAVRHQHILSQADLVRVIEGIGFEAQTAAENPMALDDLEAKALYRAVAVAGFGMMNIMLLSISIWSGAGGGDARSVSLAVCTDRNSSSGLCRTPLFLERADGSATSANQYGRTDQHWRPSGDRAKRI